MLLPTTKTTFLHSLSNYYAKFSYTRPLIGIPGIEDPKEFVQP